MGQASNRLDMNQNLTKNEWMLTVQVSLWIIIERNGNQLDEINFYFVPSTQIWIGFKERFTLNYLIIHKIWKSSNLHKRESSS